MLRFAKRFAGDESGATVIEYALIASFIFVAITTVLGDVATQLGLVFTGIHAGMIAGH